MPPPMTRSTSGAARSTQPRRKSSATLQQRRESSVELMDHDHAAPSIEEHAMDVDDHGSNNYGKTVEPQHPLQYLADRVGKEVELFAEELDKWKSNLQTEDQGEKQDAVLGLVSKYQGVADDAVRRLRRLHDHELRQTVETRYSDEQEQKQGQDTASDDLETGLADLIRWQEELHTWNLAYEILQCDFGGLDPDNLVQDNDRFAADGTHWYDFLEENKSAQERLVVLKWLETTAEVTGEDVNIIETRLDERSKRTTYDGWIDTRERLKGEKRLRMWDVPIDSTGSQAPTIRNADGTASIVTQLDPDAPTRQEVTLEKDDLQFERSFWIMVWEMLRRGTPMDKIREWCADRGQQARALSFGAHADDTSQYPTRRWLWRQACHRLSRVGGLTDFERAVYGIVSGDDKSTEHICRSWNDFFYVHYNCKLLRQYESWLLATHGAKFPKIKEGNLRLPWKSSEGENHIEDARKLGRYLQSQDRSKHAKNNYQQHIQGALLTHDVPDFIFQLGVAMSKAAKSKRDGNVWSFIPTDAADAFPRDGNLDLKTSVTDDPDSTRALTHLYLLYQDLGYDYGSGARLDACENVLAAYVEFLKDAGKFHLMPTYAAHLSQRRRTEVLARSCPRIIDVNTRQEFVNLMLDADIDVVEVLRLHAMLCFAYSPYSYTLEEDKSAHSKISIMRPEPDHKWPYQRVTGIDQKAQFVTDEEYSLIEAMKWFALVEGAWGWTFHLLTAAAVVFLKAGRIEAAEKLFEAMPSTEVSTSKSAAHLGKAIDIMADDESSPEESPHNLRRSSRNQRQRSSSRPKESDGLPDEKKVRRALLKAHARTYYELEQLTAALISLSASVETERAVVSAKVINDSAAIKAAKSEHRQVLNDVVQGMEPLLHDFLQSPPPYVPAATLNALRMQYIPEMVLAYAATLHSAGYLMSREHLLQCLDLATNVADNDELIQCFKGADAPGYKRRGQIVGEHDDGQAIAEREAHERAAAASANGANKRTSFTMRVATPADPVGVSGDDGKGKGRMKELVECMASASRAMLDLNDMQRVGPARLKRGERTLGIWEVEA